MAEVFYKQCTMNRFNENDNLIVHTAWIPEKFAEVGRVIYFGKKTKDPDELWTVVSVPKSRKSEKYLIAHERDYKTQRQASDI